MTTIREFPTLGVATVATGVLLYEGGIGSVYEVCGHVLGDEGLMTHQLPAAASASTPVLYAQHPWLRDLDPPRGDLPALAAWCEQLVAEHGETLQVRAADPDEVAWRQGNALRDLADIMEGRPVVVVHVPAKDVDR